MKRKLFCEICPLTYKISLLKEYFIYDLKDIINKTKFSKKISTEKLPVIIKGHSSQILRMLNGVDINLQHNKAKNLKLAGDRINCIIIKSGQTFSFWKLVGKPLAKKGYLDGLTISKGAVGKNIGGGLCQLANLIHWLVLHSPMEVVELHHHTDALFPDSNRRVPFGTGTSVFYKHIDYRFKNNTNLPVQLIIWQSEGYLCGELRSTQKFEYKYQITEENHGFVEENGEYFRVSQIYRLVFDNDKQIVKKELILNNHSKVMYDYSLIPKEEIMYTSRQIN
ncbi:VanW family protein [Sedimentibacter sp. zth1]|uniref:VanW family protein n=1 Tax=Sedimentibacter sp. zth1 TaxID=2816908 RepID=UPI001A920DEA|nr:VanW family protein [Sedimentibacter sp. zth1]QSX06743.1 VanW family protein [Sedimentibacter sp. zth1]